MSESIDSPARSLISDLKETSILETTSGTKSSKINEIIANTTVSTELLHFAQKTEEPKSASTLADLWTPAVPEFSPENIKKINRAITRKMPEAERKQIISERNQLVQKQFKVSLSIKEEKRLKYIRWQLDRIDDAESGEFLDYLEKITEAHEKFAKELNAFLTQISNIQISTKKRKKTSR
jgi:hypothetical protein